MSLLPKSAEIVGRIPVAYFPFQDFTDHHRLGVFARDGCACSAPGCTRVGIEVVIWYDCNTTPETRAAGKGKHYDVAGYEPGPSGQPKMFLLVVDHAGPRGRKFGTDLTCKRVLCEGHMQAKLRDIAERRGSGFAERPR